MPLETLNFKVEAVALPPESVALLVAANDRIDAFRRTRPAELGAFVPADHAAVYAALAAVRSARLAPGNGLIEWGSGFGVVACLAAQLGFDAAGIECEAALVEQAELLADGHGLSVPFACGTFVPPEVDHLADVADDLATLAIGLADGHEELGLDPADADVVYAYPWPGEEAVVESVFEAVAADGALLLTYRSTGDLVLQRKA